MRTDEITQAADSQDSVALALSRPAELEPIGIGSSADVREFMRRPPHWLLRSGTTVLAAVLALLLVLSVIIKYPDTIIGRVTVIGSQPVMEVVARQSGHLDSLRVREGQHVKQGEILAVMQSSSQPATVLPLAEKLRRLSAAMGEDAPVPEIDFGPEEALGSLQDPYAEFLNAYHLLQSRLADDYAEKAGALLRKQLEGKRAQIESLRNQSEMIRRESELSREKFGRLKGLYESGAISTSELREQETALLQQMRAESTGQRTLSEAEIEASKVEKDLRDLEHNRAETLRTAREEFRARLNKLLGAIDVWEADYVFRAPGEGNVAFYDFWSDQQFVTAARQVFLIVPETTQLVGRMPASQGGSGKIKPGQTVRIRLDDFPYKEFGIVSGKVQSVSMVAREGAHLVLIDIPHPLVTTFKKELPFKQEMVGEARIVTEDISLLGRILYEIRRAFVNNTSN
ncbi:MAG: HlyD family efflux transporter periplasmic adaptor subunit [Chthoniobacterales bacterium]